MRSALPKHLHPLLGRRLVDWVILAAQASGAGRVVVVTSPDARDAFAGLEVAVQEQPLGTGDAVRAARAALEGFDGDVLVLNGDVPGLTQRPVQGRMHQPVAKYGQLLDVPRRSPPEPGSRPRDSWEQEPAVVVEAQMGRALK